MNETDIRYGYRRDVRELGWRPIEKLYVDPVTHELLAWTAFSTVDDAFMVYVVQDSGSSPRGRWLPSSRNDPSR
jgi:hypothetical protein